jgi:hypothetical protein
MLLGKMLKQFSLWTVTLGHIKSQHIIDSVRQTVNNAVRRRFKGIVNTGNNGNPPPPPPIPPPNSPPAPSETPTPAVESN